ncbi:MAG: hypothetical protein ACK5LC_08675 [Coprobacillaceae bacterium]
MEGNNIVTDEQIKECLKYPLLTCKQIALITGTSVFAARQLRLTILEEYYDKFPYSKGAKIRTDHFLERYDNPRLTKLYEDLYGIKIPS